MHNQSRYQFSKLKNDQNYDIMIRMRSPLKCFQWFTFSKCANLSSWDVWERHQIRYEPVQPASDSHKFEFETKSSKYKLVNSIHQMLNPNYFTLILVKLLTLINFSFIVLFLYFVEILLFFHIISKDTYSSLLIYFNY